jgi:hypothetical protein
LPQRKVQQSRSLGKCRSTAGELASRWLRRRAVLQQPGRSTDYSVRSCFGSSAAAQQQLSHRSLRIISRLKRTAACCTPLKCRSMQPLAQVQSSMPTASADSTYSSMIIALCLKCGAAPLAYWLQTRVFTTSLKYSCKLAACIHVKRGSILTR